MEGDDREYSLAISVATLLMAAVMTEWEKDDERHATKVRILRRKHDLLIDAFCGDLEGLASDGEGSEETESAVSVSQLATELGGVTERWSEELGTTLLVDLALTDPFTPYEVKTSASQFETALARVVEALDQPPSMTDDVLKTRKESLRAHRSLPWKKVVATGAVGTVVVATGGWALAPVLATALGGAAGLSGAVATAHGLALLGGGSLAAGGAGMAGGMWLVTGAGALAGAVAGGGGQALRELGVGQARVELVKLQMSYRLHVLHSQAHLYKAQQVTAQLDQSREQLEAQLEEERQLNDRNAARIREIEEILAAIDSATQDVEAVGAE